MQEWDVYQHASQRTEDQWPMTSWLVHVARARVHVTTRVRIVYMTAYAHISR